MMNKKPLEVIPIGVDGEMFLILAKCTKEDALRAFAKYGEDELFLDSKEFCDENLIKPVMVKVGKPPKEEWEYENYDKWYSWGEDAKGNKQGWLLSI